MDRLNPRELRDIQNKPQGNNRRTTRRNILPVVSVYITAHWRLYVWNYAFSTTVISLQLGFGAWQCYKYGTNEAVREAFGWGVPVAKFGAGALYPTFFFLVLSMSRWLATLCRYFGSQKYLNWDRHRYFHIRMAIMTLVLSLLHTCGHVMGTFPTAVQAEHREAVRDLIGTKIEHINWRSLLLSRPGWTGVGALLIFMMITTFSLPVARKMSFETFQIVHLLIFPMLVLLALHGTAALLQHPAFGFVVAGPLMIILCENVARASQLLQSRIARIKPIGSNSVEVTIFAPGGNTRRFYRPGQYILVRVPNLSRFQWHPFTVVRAGESELVVIAKNKGGWTQCLQGQPEFTNVNLDGPFGAPCQGFWNYDNTILIGMGTGLTPSAAIIHELLASPVYPWITDQKKPENAGFANNNRKNVSVLWVVRDATSLESFIPLLAAMTSLPQHGCLELRCDIYVSRSMTPLHTEGGPIPPGVIFSGKRSRVEIHLGKRPSFINILQDHHQEFSTELRETVSRTGQPRTTRPRVGVFFCGPPNTKSELRKLCFERTLQGVVDGSDLEYHFHPEVF